MNISMNKKVKNMKRLLFCVATVLLVQLASAQVLSRKVLDVNDYFVKLPQCIFDKGKTGKELMSLRNSLMQPGFKRTVAVDKAKGFMKISDKSTVQFQFEVTLKLFDKNDKSTVVLLHEFYATDSCDTYLTRTFVLDQRNGTLSEVKGLVPRPEFNSFMAVQLKKQGFLAVDSNINFSLAPSLNEAKIACIPVAAKSDNCLKFSPFDKSVKLTAQQRADSVAAFRNTVKNRAKPSLDLVWKPETGKFEISK